MKDGLETRVCNVGGFHKRRDYSLPWYRECYRGRIAKDLVWIMGDPFGNAICIRIPKGEICFWDHETGKVAQLATSFTKFIDGLQLTKDDSPQPPLHAAARQGDVDALKQLIEQNNFDSRELTIAMEIAAQRQECECVAYLLDVGARIDGSGGPKGRTPLQDAAYTGKEDVVELLVKRGAELFIGKDGADLLREARMGGNHDIAQFLAQEMQSRPHSRSQALVFKVNVNFGAEIADTDLEVLKEQLNAHGIFSRVEGKLFGPRAHLTLAVNLQDHDKSVAETKVRAIIANIDNAKIQREEVETVVTTDA